MYIKARHGRCATDFNWKIKKHFIKLNYQHFILAIEQFYLNDENIITLDWWVYTVALVCKLTITIVSVRATHESRKTIDGQTHESMKLG